MYTNMHTQSNESHKTSTCSKQAHIHRHPDFRTVVYRSAVKSHSHRALCTAERETQGEQRLQTGERDSPALEIPHYNVTTRLKQQNSISRITTTQ